MEIKEVTVTDHWDYQSVTLLPEEPHHGYHEEVDELATLDIAVIALDCTKRPRRSGLLIGNFPSSQENIPSAVDGRYLDGRGLTAVEAGVDFVGTTLSGYTDYSPKVDGPRF